MQTITPELIQDKKVLLRFDIDVPLRKAQGKLEVEDDFRLKAGLPTLKLCLENASTVIMMGHIGRPEGMDKSLSVAPIYEWLKGQGFGAELENGKLRLLENLRFEVGEEALDLEYAKKLAAMGDFFVNESFAAYRPASSTTILPTLLPHAAGLRFTEEVEKITRLRENPTKPFVAIMGGAKVKDKLPVIKVLAKLADAVLIGGKLVYEIKDQQVELPSNVLLGQMTDSGFDISASTVLAWESVIRNAKTIVWNGPLGKVEDVEFGTKKIAQIVIESGAESIIGGGDTIAALKKWGLLDKFVFISTGGGAMLKLLSDGTLPTIEALE